MLPSAIRISTQPCYNAVQLEKTLGEKKHLLLFDACEMQDVDQTIALLGALVNPNIPVKERGNQLPLHAAVKKGNTIIIPLLLAHRADPNIRDSEGDSALWHAAKANDIAGQILLHVADDISEDGLLVPRTIDYRNYDFAKRLLECGSKVRPSEVYYSLDYALVDGKMLLANQIIDQAQDLEKLLCLAVRKGNIDVVQFVLKYRVYVDCEDYKTGQTPLHVAARKGYDDVVKALLEAGADVNTVWKDKKGGRRGYTTYKWTPLAMAAKRGRGEVVKSLLAYGAEFKGESALIEALENHHFRTAKILLKGGANIDDADSYENIWDHKAATFLKKHGAVKERSEPRYPTPISEEDIDIDGTTTTCSSDASENDEFSYYYEESDFELFPGETSTISESTHASEMFSEESTDYGSSLDGRYL